MKNLRFEEQKIKKKHNQRCKNLFQNEETKKETNNAAIKGIKNLFRLKNKNTAIKEKIIRAIRNHLSIKEKTFLNPQELVIFRGKSINNNNLFCLL